MYDWKFCFRGIKREETATKKKKKRIENEIFPSQEAEKGFEVTLLQVCQPVSSQQTEGSGFQTKNKVFYSVLQVNYK